MDDLDLYTEWAQQQAQEISREIDREVLYKILVEAGWHRVRLEWPKTMNDVRAHEIKEWCRANLKGEYKGQGSDWIFEQGRDATLFVLKFS